MNNDDNGLVVMSVEDFFDPQEKNPELVDLLVKNPSLADQCDWKELTGWDWSKLLSERPQFADKCDWPKLNGKNWARLLTAQPQFADECDWSLLEGDDWSRLLCE